MANRKKEVYKPKPMTEGKRNLIQGLLQEYDIQSADDIQEALKDLLSGTLQDMLETEMDNHLGYDRYERSSEPNYRNGTKSKTVRSKYGEFEVDVPQDRQSSFEPQVLPKRQKDISSIDDKIIAMYAKGMTTRQISETIEDIYGFEVSEGMVSDITDKLLPKIEEWQNRPLSPVYPIVFIDAVHFSVRDDGVIRKLAAYVVLGINEDGMKEVLNIVVGENESSKYWLSVLNSLKNRGVQDILILCSDGLTGIKDAISTAFPKTEQTDYDEHFFYVRQQLVDEHEFEVTQDGATMGKRYRRIKDPKGNANYSIRPIELTPYNRNIIEQMLALHEPSPYLFTCQGRPLITDTFNKRLKKYTTEIDIPYLSTHKLRFTSASLAKNQGQCEQDIQHNLGHSNIQQTQHYDSHATTEYNYGMAADIYDKKYNVTKCNQTFEHKKIAPNLDKLKA